MIKNSSSDYLTYKKSRMNPSRVQRVEKRVEKVKRILKLSFVTFCIMFICVVVFIKKYAKRVDIEYGRNWAEASKQAPNSSINDNYFNDTYDSDKRSIDKRLTLIQQEENAPSESRVLPQDRDKNEVMNFEHFERLKSNTEEDIDTDLIEPVQSEPKPEKKQVQKTTQASQDKEKAQLLPKQTGETNASNTSSTNFAPIELPAKSNIKVLIGKYSTFDEAKTAQSAMKNSKAKIAQFIRKVDDVYCLQIGSYSNMDVARSVAGSFGKEGFDVWIYQQ